MWGLFAFVGALLFSNKANAGIFSKPGGESYGPPTSAFTAASAQDIDTLARTIWGEARSEGRAGMQAVANVVMNRFKQAQQSRTKASRFGATIRGVCLKARQFSAWNFGDPNRAMMQGVTLANPAFRLAYEIAQDAVMGKLSDLTNGSDHYHTVSIRPDWSNGKAATKVIGSHRFYNNIA